MRVWDGGKLSVGLGLGFIDSLVGSRVGSDWAGRGV